MAAIAPAFAGVPTRAIRARAPRISSRASVGPAVIARRAPGPAWTQLASSSSSRDRDRIRCGTRTFAAASDATAAPDAAADPDAPAKLDLKGDELVLVVGGAGRVGRRIVTRLTSSGCRCRVLTRDPSSSAASSLLDACPPGTVELTRGDVTERGPEGDAALAAAIAGCTQVVACFGAQRLSKITDILGVGSPETNDRTHPAAVNHRGVARLAALAASAGTVRRFVRVTGMSVGYHPANFVAVALNAVLSMTITWQLLGEKAVRDSGLEYTVVRPGNLLETPRPDGSVVLVGHGDAHVPAGKVSRDDVAELIALSMFRANCANATIGVAGAPAPTGGIRSEMAWDPARGMHYRAVEHEETVYEGTDLDGMLAGVGKDIGELNEKRHKPFVAAFVALLCGVGVAFAWALVAAVRAVFKL